MDGLVLKISYEFLKNLKDKGLESTDIRVKFAAKSSTKNSKSFYGSYRTFDDFYAAFANILESPRYLCSSGSFPIIENVKLTNKNLNFKNVYSWYNITETRRLIKNVQYDSKRSAFYETEIERYISMINQDIDYYVANINQAIKIRLDDYMDPCYVNAGYKAPESYPLDTLSTLFVPTTPTDGFITANVPSLNDGNVLILNFLPNGAQPIAVSPTGFYSAIEMLNWAKQNLASYGTWSLNSNEQIQLNYKDNINKAITELTVTVDNIPILNISTTPTSFTKLTTGRTGQPCTVPYNNGSTIVYPNIEHSYKFTITNSAIDPATVCNAFSLSISGIGTNQNPYIRSCTTGSATVSNGKVNWTGNLFGTASVTIEIGADVTNGGKADVWTGPGIHPSHTDAPLNSINNNAYVPLNYTVSALIDDSNLYYANPTNISSSISGNLTVSAINLYYKNRGTLQLSCVQSYPFAIMFDVADAAISWTNLTFGTIPIVTFSPSSPSPWFRSNLADWATYISNSIGKLGYAWCWTANDTGIAGYRYHGININSYYDYSALNTPIGNSLNYQETRSLANNLYGSYTGTLNSAPSEYLKVGDTVVPPTGICQDVYFP